MPPRSKPPFRPSATFPPQAAGKERPFIMTDAGEKKDLLPSPWWLSEAEAGEGGASGRESRKGALGWEWLTCLDWQIVFQNFKYLWLDFYPRMECGDEN